MDVSLPGLPDRRQELATLTNYLHQFQAWDRTFENVRGSYPSQGMADDFKTLNDRFGQDVKRIGTSGGPASSVAGMDLWFDHAELTSTEMALQSLAKYKMSFDYDGKASTWGTKLDKTVTDLTRAVRLLAELPAPQPGPFPNPGPGPSNPGPYPQPPYPGPSPYPAPQPNPYPQPSPYPAPQPNPYPAPQPEPAPWPNEPAPWPSEPAPWPTPGNGYPGDS